MPVRGRARRRRGRRPASRRSGASTPDACGALKSRARPRSSIPGTPRRQAPARGRLRRRRDRRLRLGLDALDQRDKDVEGGALDAVRHAPTKPVSTTCERAASTAWSARANAPRRRLGASRRVRLRARRRPRGTASAERRRRLRSVVDARAVPGAPAPGGSADKRLKLVYLYSVRNPPPGKHLPDAAPLALAATSTSSSPTRSPCRDTTPRTP